MASTHVDSHLPSHHALVDVVANDSLSHECPVGHTAHIVDDSHLQGVAAELTVFQHVVFSKWSKSFMFGFSILSGLHLCIHHLHLTPRFPHFHSYSWHQHPLRRFQRRAVFSLTSRVRGERCSGCNSEMALFAALHFLSHAAFGIPDSRVATGCSFYNSDCNAGLI